MRWAERGVSPVRASLIGIAALALICYLVFYKQLPFTHAYTIRAVVANSNLLAPGSPVRIGGADVGRVIGSGRYRKSSLALVTMQLADSGQAIHADATIAIRPRLFLEGNFYVQLSPGTPDAPPLADGGTIPLAHTSGPVQIDQLLDTFPADARLALQRTLRGLGQALDERPAAAERPRLDPAVRNLTGAQAINETFSASVPALRDTAIVSQALTGPDGAQLSRVVSGLGRATEGLARADGELTALVLDFDHTLQVAAARERSVRQTVQALGPTSRHAHDAFVALGSALAPTERFTGGLTAGFSQLPATIAAGYPWLAQAGPLLSDSELGGLLRALAPASAQLAALTDAELRFLPEIDAFDRCITQVFLPTGNIVVNDGSLSSGVPNYQEFWYAMTGQAAEGQGADGNGNFLRIGAAGGPQPVESGQTNYYASIDTGFAQLAAAPLRTRPAFANHVPPLRRATPCFTQPVPDVNGAPSYGPADGSRPNAPRPPLPVDPTRRIPTGGGR